jgi:hypothetical protein
MINIKHFLGSEKKPEESIKLPSVDDRMDF